MREFEIERVRAQFPALKLRVDGEPAVFLDAPGGTQVPQRVIEAMRDCLAHRNANTHGAFLSSHRADETVEEAHLAMADFLGCDAEEVVFGPNMTTLAFALSHALARELEPGDEVIVTNLDHDANVAPWLALEERGAVIRTVDIREDDCTLDLESFHSRLNEKTRLAAVGYASNSVGTINDVAALTRAAHEAGAWVFVDAVHYAPHGPIDVRETGCDFLACSPYKFFGPHQGVLYGKAEHLRRLRPDKVRPAPEELPWRWETGTQNHEAQAGVAAAIDYLADLGARQRPGGAEEQPSRRQKLLWAMEAIRRYERSLAEKLIGGLLERPRVQFYGIREPERFGCRTPTVSIRIEGRDPRQVAEELGRKGFFVWDGNYYALRLSERLGVEARGGMLRIGLVHYNTPGEVARFLDELTRIAV